MNRGGRRRGARSGGGGGTTKVPIRANECLLVKQTRFSTLTTARLYSFPLQSFNARASTYSSRVAFLTETICEWKEISGTKYIYIYISSSTSFSKNTNKVDDLKVRVVYGNTIRGGARPCSKGMMKFRILINLYESCLTKLASSLKIRTRKVGGASGNPD